MPQWLQIANAIAQLAPVEVQLLSAIVNALHSHNQASVPSTPTEQSPASTPTK
jgi:hypothetical protein